MFTFHENVVSHTILYDTRLTNIFLVDVVSTHQFPRRCCLINTFLVDVMCLDNIYKESIIIKIIVRQHLQRKYIYISEAT